MNWSERGFLLPTFATPEGSIIGMGVPGRTRSQRRSTILRRSGGLFLAGLAAWGPTLVCGQGHPTWRRNPVAARPGGVVRDNQPAETAGRQHGPSVWQSGRDSKRDPGVTGRYSELPLRGLALLPQVGLPREQTRRRKTGGCWRGFRTPDHSPLRAMLYPAELSTQGGTVFQFRASRERFASLECSAHWSMPAVLIVSPVCGLQCRCARRAGR